MITSDRGPSLPPANPKSRFSLLSQAALASAGGFAAASAGGFAAASAGGTPLRASLTRNDSKPLLQTPKITNISSHEALPEFSVIRHPHVNQFVDDHVIP